MPQAPAKAHILRHRAPWQQSELLEPPWHLALPHMAQRGLVAGDDIDILLPSAHENISARHLVKAMTARSRVDFPETKAP